MSRPTEEQAKQLISRIRCVLKEWDDVRFVVAIKIEGDDWCFDTSANAFQRMVVARGLLEEAIVQCLEHDPEIDT